MAQYTGIYLMKLEWGVFVVDELSQRKSAKP